MPYNPVTLLNQYWLGELGCSEQDICTAHTIVRPHGTLKGYKGIMVLKKGETCIVSAPNDLVDELNERMAGQQPFEAFKSENFRQILGNRIEKVVGPAWLGGIGVQDYLRKHNESARELSSWESFEQFLSECPTEDVELSSLKSGRSPVVAVFQSHRIVAASGFEILEKLVAHIGILTHPDFRGRGYAKQAISAIVEIALREQMGVQYWTHGNNLPSIRAATEVGFSKFAETLAIRIK